MDTGGKRTLLGSLEMKRKVKRVGYMGEGRPNTVSRQKEKIKVQDDR